MPSQVSLCSCGHSWTVHYQDGCTFKLGRARLAYCECIETGTEDE